MTGNLFTHETWQGPVEGAVHRNYNNDFRVVSWRIGDLPGITNSYDPDGTLIQAGNFVLQRDANTGMLTNTTTGDVSVRLAWTRFAELAQNAAVIAAQTCCPLNTTAMRSDGLPR